MSNATCPYIRSSDEGTHWCALAESSVKERDAEIARLRQALKASADQRETALRQLEDATVEMLRLQADNQRLSESIIANSATYESDRFALKSEIEELREAIKKIADPDDAMWPGTNITRDAIKRIAREALAAHAPVEGEKPV